MRPIKILFTAGMQVVPEFKYSLECIGLFVQQDFKLLHWLNMSHDTLTVTFYRDYI